MVAGDDNQNGAGGPASASGATKPYFGKTGMPGMKVPGASRVIKAVSNPFHNDNAGKLSKSASTRSESLARLRGKGALA